MPTEPMIGEIRFWANPRPMGPGWLPCDGRALPQGNPYSRLFVAIGYSYGRDGNNFRLPDLRHRTAIGAGAGDGLSPHAIGQVGGADTVAQTKDNMPGHTHSMDFDGVTGVATHAAEIPSIFSSPQEGGYLAQGTYKQGISLRPGKFYRSSPAADSLVATATTFGTAKGNFQPAGEIGPEPRQNRQPYMVQGFYIAFQGTEPIRPHH